MTALFRSIIIAGCQHSSENQCMRKEPEGIQLVQCFQIAQMTGCENKGSQGEHYSFALGKQPPEDQNFVSNQPQDQSRADSSAKSGRDDQTGGYSNQYKANSCQPFQKESTAIVFIPASKIIGASKE